MNGARQGLQDLLKDGVQTQNALTRDRIQPRQSSSLEIRINVLNFASLSGSFSGSNGSLHILIYTGSNSVVFNSGAQAEGSLDVPLKTGGDFRLVAQNYATRPNSMTIFLNFFSEERNSSKENALRQQVEREDAARAVEDMRCESGWPAQSHTLLRKSSSENLSTE
jgi:hypothetical protein